VSTTTVDAVKPEIDDEPYEDDTAIELTVAKAAPEPEKPTPKPAPEKPKHSAGIVRAAKRLGIPDDRIEAADPEALADAVDLLTERRLEELEAPKAKKAPEPEPEEEDELDADVRADLENWNPTIAKAVTKLAGSAKAVKALEKKLAALEADRDQSKASTVQSRMIADADAAFAESGHEKVFGKGTVTEVTDRKLIDRRGRVYAAATAELQRNPKANWKDCVKKVIADLYGEAEPVEPEEKDEYAAKWKAGTVAKPSKKKPDEKPRSRERAIEFAKKFKESSVAVDDKEEETLPD
jgi:hypothetical protein